MEGARTDIVLGRPLEYGRSKLVSERGGRLWGSVDVAIAVGILLSIVYTVIYGWSGAQIIGEGLMQWPAFKELVLSYRGDFVGIGLRGFVGGFLVGNFTTVPRPLMVAVGVLPLLVSVLLAGGALSHESDVPLWLRLQMAILALSAGFSPSFGVYLGSKFVSGYWRKAR
jgi:hypothetical protein